MSFSASLTASQAFFTSRATWSLTPSRALRACFSWLSVASRAYFVRPHSQRSHVATAATDQFSGSRYVAVALVAADHVERGIELALHDLDPFFCLLHPRGVEPDLGPVLEGRLEALLEGSLVGAVVEDVLHVGGRVDGPPQHGVETGPGLQQAVLGPDEPLHAVGKPHLGLQVVVARHDPHLVEALRQVPLGLELLDGLFGHADQALRLEDGVVAPLDLQHDVLHDPELLVPRGVDPQALDVVVRRDPPAREQGLPGIEGPGVVVLRPGDDIAHGHGRGEPDEGVLIEPRVVVRRAQLGEKPREGLLASRFRRGDPLPRRPDGDALPEGEGDALLQRHRRRRLLRPGDAGKDQRPEDDGCPSRANPSAHHTHLMMNEEVGKLRSSDPLQARRILTDLPRFLTSELPHFGFSCCLRRPNPASSGTAPRPPRTPRPPGSSAPRTAARERPCRPP